MAKRKKEGLSKLLDSLKRFETIKLVILCFELIKKSWGRFLIATGLDFLFLVGFSLVVGFFQTRVFEHLYTLLLYMGKQTGGVIQEIQNPFSGNLSRLASDTTFIYHIENAIYNLLLMFVCILIVWCVLEGLNWWMLHKLNKDSVELKQYIGSFIVSSVLFFGITLLSLSYFLKQYIDVGFAIESLITKETVFGLYIASLIVIWYFGFISYSLSYSSIWKNISEAL